MEPPDLDEDGEGAEEEDPCGALGADPDPESQAYADCMGAAGDGGDEGEVEDEEGGPVEETASIQDVTTLEEGDEGGDTIVKPLLPSNAKLVTKTITLEYADGTKATVMETFPELPVPTESPVPNPDPAV